MTDFPAPLIPADVDLQGFEFTPIYRVRLFGSRFHARVSDAGWRAGVTLWLRSWEQVPAGTLPEDEVDLCRLAELGRDLKTWRKLSEEALWGWFKCSDGRLHHKTVAEGVLSAWDGKLKQRWRAECARIRKHNERHRADINQPEFEEWKSQGCPSGQSLTVTRDTPTMSQGHPPDCHKDTADVSHECSRETPSNREGYGEGDRKKEEGNLAVSSPKQVRTRKEYPEDFEMFWKGYPSDSLMSKEKASLAWAKMDIDDRISAIGSLPAFSAYCRQKTDYRPVHAVRYLTERRYDGFAQIAVNKAATHLVKVGTAQWKAWDQHYRQSGKTLPVSPKDDGWFLPTEWPPQDGAHP